MCQIAQTRKFTSKFIATSVRDIFKQSNLLDGAILWAVSFTLNKLETENLYLATKNLHPQMSFLISSRVVQTLDRAIHWINYSPVDKY